MVLVSLKSENAELDRNQNDIEEILVHQEY